MPNSPMIIGVLASGTGRTLQNLIDQQAAGQLDTRIGIVIGSRQGLGVLEKAANARLLNFVVDGRLIHTPQDYSRKIFELLDDAGVELVCMAGWLNLLQIPEKYQARIMNIHPSLLPSFGGKGMFGRKVHQAVLDYGCKVSGCTVHYVDATYDTGPIVIQRTCAVLDDDTADTLGQRVFEEEKIAYPQAIRLFQQGRLKLAARRVLGA